MTSLSSPCDLPDPDLLAELERAVACERQTTARLIALLMEVDSRKLYLGQGCSSLFTYCVQQLHLSEHAAYLRIEAARLAGRFPPVLDRLADGSLHLTAVSLLGPHLRASNHVELLESARHMSKREVELLIARVRPQPDALAVVRKLPALNAAVVPSSNLPVSAPEIPYRGERSLEKSSAPTISAPVTARVSEIRPLAPERYKVQCTVSRETYEKLRRAQDFLRHAIPTGDLPTILDRALTVLLAELVRTKFAATDRPRRGYRTTPRSRHVPAAVKREVWTRDGGRCAFHGEQGRCAEAGFVEFHHVIPYTDGGETSARNLELRCRAHNQYEAEQWFGVKETAIRLPISRKRCGAD